MDSPLVSIIVPVYNGERYLSVALESVFAQNYHPFEVIVVDDGSVDGTADIARSYKEVRYIYQTNQGPGMARHVGITVAQGEFLAFLDADDLWTTNKLSVQVNYLLKHPHVGYTISRMRIFVEPGTDLPPWLNKNRLTEEISAYLPSALVVRKIVIEKIGDFDPTYRHAADSDWFFRANDAGISMAILPEVLLYRRIHSSNLCRERQAMASEMLQVVKLSIDRKRQRSTKD